MNVHAAVKKLNKVQRSVAAGILFLLVLITAFYIAAKISAGAELRAAADKGGTWELSDGRCSLSIDDFHFIDGTDSGLDGLRRYIIVNDGCKEYY